MDIGANTSKVMDAMNNRRHGAAPPCRSNNIDAPGPLSTVRGRISPGTAVACAVTAASLILVLTTPDSKLSSSASFAATSFAHGSLSPYWGTLPHVKATAVAWIASTRWSDLVRTTHREILHHDEAGDTTQASFPSSSFSTPSSSLSSCGIYLAPSTIPGAGMGMFAGRSFKEDEVVTSGDVVVPLTDWYSHNWHIDVEEILMHYYYWQVYMIHGMPEESADAYAFSPGVGAAINCYFPLVNVQGSDSDTQMDSAGLHRSRDPGVGAFSYYHGRDSRAYRAVAAGEELFTDYGENYFVNNEEAYGKMPVYSSYDEADKLLRRYLQIQRSVCNSHSPVPSSPLSNTSASSSSTTCELHEPWYSLLTDLKQVWSSRTLNALPDNSDVVEHIAEIGTSWTHYNRSVRSLDWLEENGWCMDNLVEGVSTTARQAGRGAFARRHLPRGSVVAPAPLVHVDRSLLDMYPLRSDEWNGLRGDRSSRPVQKQLLLNYCFGSDNVRVLLCPYGMHASLINHAPSRPDRNSTATANVRIEWNERLMKNPEWLSLPVDAWIGEIHVGLAFSYVATRDISPGEEVLLDYGPEWEEAWDRHVSSWRPPAGSAAYVASYELNDDPDLVVRVSREGWYPEKYVRQECFDLYRELSGSLSPGPSDMYPCRAVARDRRDGEYRYLVELYLRDHDWSPDKIAVPNGPESDDDRHSDDDGSDSSDDEDEEEGTLRRRREPDQQCTEMLFEVLFDAPRDVFRFTDAPYSRDMAQPWAFRHPLGIPDALLPRAWLAAP